MNTSETLKEILNTILNNRLNRLERRDKTEWEDIVHADKNYKVLYSNNSYLIIKMS